MTYRFEFVEPLIRMGLDFSAEDRDGWPAYSLSPSVANNEAVHQLMLSRNIYDQVAGMTFWTATRMTQSAHIFDFFVANIFPEFYQWPLKGRIRMLYQAIWYLDPKTIGLIFHPDGRFHLDDLRYQAVSSTGKTVFERLVDVYFAIRCEIGFARITARGTDEDVAGRFLYDERILEHQWSEIRVVIRETVATADYSDLCSVKADTGRTPLLEAMWLSRRQVRGCRIGGHQAASPRRHRLWRQEIQEMVRDWLEDLQAAGKDLEVYGKEEVAAFRGHNPFRRARWSHGSKKAGYKWSGFMMGPRPEDCNLHWEWDPDVEGIAGEFWACIEDPPLPIMPGSWVDDDDNSVCSDEFDDRYWSLGPYYEDRFFSDFDDDGE